VGISIIIDSVVAVPTGITSVAGVVGLEVAVAIDAAVGTFVAVAAGAAAVVGAEVAAGGTGVAAGLPHAAKPTMARPPSTPIKAACLSFVPIAFLFIYPVMTILSSLSNISFLSGCKMPASNKALFTRAPRCHSTATPFGSTVTT
jgi:hypothetical protein